MAAEVEKIDYLARPAKSGSKWRERGYSIDEIAAKVDFGPDYISAICHLLENGEEKLISAVERGVIPHTIAMEIAKAKEGDVQQALAQAYEEKSIPGNQVLAIRQIINQRNTSGKGIHRTTKFSRKPTTAGGRASDR